MHTIGCISHSNEISKEYKEIFKTFKWNVQMINKETADQLFESNNKVLQSMDTLIIEDFDSNNINWTCELIMNVRKQTTLPLWILSSPEATNRTNRIVYLQLGADGIIEKDYEPDESLLMMRNLLKRFKERENQLEVPQREVSEPTADFKLIPQNLSVCLEGGKEVNLTKLEFLTIEYLHKHARKTMTYEEIYKNVWNDTYGNRKYRVSNLVFHLRKKLEMDIEKPKYIKTIRSKGYMLNI
ncbi:winged helix family transcriptional regulator [Enterococcus caccae]|uniref:OmpR/PhoB-type domain-containing protein n=1 Tax=Enterococcus caccae ATCC BAA-1240 TaxID=1158612 RepID=R3W7W7_9ENTE|nr:winged helix-turn-helix domain-containing protein [Enterococcus caccae]EOL43592.1 hypothetical protein UC7_02922 [Enterococcus caccae ATCC BAA-1240]EOT68008.1 hypothetical protein I580_00390 [Enterococcus caccae ATCC BAA-1240]OJG28503.1 hypothetical protein RU98_GL000096 [Enterococcus caccae]